MERMFLECDFDTLWEACCFKLDVKIWAWCDVKLMLCRVPLSGMMQQWVSTRLFTA